MEFEKGKAPVKSLNADGTLLFWVTQKTSAFLLIYNPGSIIIGFALWNLPIITNNSFKISSDDTKKKRRKNARQND